MTLQELNAADRVTFVKDLGWIFEDSPWVAERAWTERPFEDVDALHRAMVAKVEQATPEEQLGLLRAHPDLGTKARMSGASAKEQSGAGLTTLPSNELARLAAYRERFGFPFLFAVKGSTTQDIFHALDQRMQSSPTEEFREALRQVYRIARFRLDAWTTPKDAHLANARNYYGKGDVIVYRLDRRANTIFAANVEMLVYGDAFWPTYATGDNTGLIATDSMKNFIQKETLNFDGASLEQYCQFIATKFMGTYPQVEGVQVSAAEIPYGPLTKGGLAFVPAGPENAAARIEVNRSGVVESSSAMRGFKLLRLGGSAFFGFVRDAYTTLPDIRNRPLHMWLDLEWTPAQAIREGVREVVHEVFQSFESGSIQQVIYQIGTRILSEYRDVAEVHLEANNRTWDTVVEHGDELGVYTDARPPFGVLALRLRR